MPTTLILQVHTDTADAEELGELTADLRQHLVNAGLDASAITTPEPFAYGRMTADRAVDPSLLNVLLVSLTGANGLRAIVKAIEIIVKSRICSVRIRTPDGKEFDYTGNLSSQQSETLAQLLAAQETGGNPANPGVL